MSAGVEPPPVATGAWPQRLPRAGAALAAAVVVGVGLRLLLALVVLPGQGFEGDVDWHSTWLVGIAGTGPGGFYAWATGQPVLPPVWLWLLWPLGLVANAIAGVAGQPVEAIAPLLVKIPAVVADVAIAVVLAGWLGRRHGPRTGLAAAALFLLVPVTIIDSAVWGQFDSVGSLLALVALLLLYDGRSEASAGFAAAAVLTKPQFGLVALVVAIVLVRRHLLRPGSGPVPAAGHGSGRRAAVEAGAARTQGPLRLATSAGVAIAVGLLLIVPFDLGSRAPAPFAGIPVVDDIAGLVVVIRRMFTYFTPLTANAYNPWVFVGPHPYLLEFGDWTLDKVRLLGPLRAWMAGTGLLATALLVTAIHLLRRGERAAILATAAILTAAFFLVPTRSHERYLFPLFVYAAPLAALSLRWAGWYLLLGLANAANLYGVLTFYGTPTVAALPGGDVLRSPVAIALLAIAQALLVAWAAWQVARGRAPDPARGAVPERPDAPAHVPSRARA